MRPLFVRVFLSFLFAMAAAAIVFTIVLGAMRRDSLQASWGKISSGALVAVAQTAADEWREGYPEKADSYVAGVGRIMGLDLTLYSDDDQPIVRRMQATESETAIVRDAFEHPDGDMVLTLPRLIGAFVVSNSSAHRRFVLMAHVHGNLATSLVPPVLRLSIAVLVVGIVTYALARSITDPILMLRRATASLAGGDLSARVANTAPLSRRKDEIGALGRDFDRMNELIEGLLTISRLDSPEKLKREPAPAIDLVRLVRDVCQDADYEAIATGRRCVAETPPSMTPIAGDIELLHRAIENVTRNAVRYTAVGTSVELDLTEWADRRQAILQVRDHGPGVADDVLPDLFRPFYRVAEARDRASGGAGLGLAIADRAVRYHGGEIRAENAADGGLIVTITLPLNSRSFISRP